MIWFACKKCSKVHGRPENSSGAMIFCDCGQNLMVPWESTAKEPPMPDPVELPLAPTLEPLMFPTTSSNGPAATLDRPSSRNRESERPSRGRRRRKHVVDPNICFNHERTPSKTVCRDCGLGFCDQCLVEFEGASLCGPCKNFRIRLVQQPQETPGLAVLALLGALLTTPFFFCLLPLGKQNAMPMLALIAILPEIGAMLAAVVVLSRLGKSGKTGGRSLAFATIVASLVLTFLMGLLTIFGDRVG
jgi:hypothetical protein